MRLYAAGMVQTGERGDRSGYCLIPTTGEFLTTHISLSQRFFLAILAAVHPIAGMPFPRSRLAPALSRQPPPPLNNSHHPSQPTFYPHICHPTHTHIHTYTTPNYTNPSQSRPNQNKSRPRSTPSPSLSHPRTQAGFAKTHEAPKAKPVFSTRSSPAHRLCTRTPNPPSLRTNKHLLLIASEQFVSHITYLPRSEPPGQPKKT